MDSTISQDPFTADTSSASSLFPAARWTRAGATPEELGKLSASFSALTVAAQGAEQVTIKATSDNELAQALAAQRASGAFTGFIPNRPAPAPVAAVTDPGFGPGLGHAPVAEPVGAGDDGEHDALDPAVVPEVPVAEEAPVEVDATTLTSADDLADAGLDTLTFVTPGQVAAVAAQNTQAATLPGQ